MATNNDETYASPPQFNPFLNYDNDDDQEVQEHIGLFRAFIGLSEETEEGVQEHIGLFRAFIGLSEETAGYIDYVFGIHGMDYEAMGSHQNIGLLDESVIMKNMQERFFQERSNDEDEASCCAVCLCNYQKDDEIGVLNCGHHFHDGCVKKWLLSRNSCPICRSIVVKNHA